MPKMSDMHDAEEIVRRNRMASHLKSDEYARHEVARIGVTRDDPRWEKMFDAAKRGWPAWRIAQAYNLPIQLVTDLRLKRG